ncbi:hypothetical protein ACLOJK_017468 [Asimina triloba]
MSAVVDLKPAFVGFRTASRPENGRNPRMGFPGFSRPRVRRTCGGGYKVTAEQMVVGASANYGKEMERLSAKESLLLAFKDAGGLEALITGKTNEMQQIDVNERITGLERLNPTLRPTTSPFLEGRWNFEWVGAGSPGLLAARTLGRFSTNVASILGMDVLVKDGYAKATANLKFLNLMESKFTLTSKLSVEGPMRMREEYVEGLLETPKLVDEAIPEQLKRQFEEAAGIFEQLPAVVKDGVANGLRLPLSKYYDASKSPGVLNLIFAEISSSELPVVFLVEAVSYSVGQAMESLLRMSSIVARRLKETTAKETPLQFDGSLVMNVKIIRDTAGAPDVLTRLEGPPPALPADTIEDYNS